MRIWGFLSHANLWTLGNLNNWAPAYLSYLHGYFVSRKSWESWKLNNLAPVYFYFIIYFIDSIDLRETKKIRVNS